MNKYDILETIGEGAYSVVLKARNKETGDFVALKKFKEGEEDELVRKTTLREVKILRLLRDAPCIVRLTEAFRRKMRLYLVFEYVGCNLLEYLEQKPAGMGLAEVRQMIFTMLVALHTCHSNSVIHRDIKPENLLVAPDHTLRLCDFGFARIFSPGMKDLTDYVATRWYRSPELLLGTTDYTLATDMWAAGCIMAELLDGQALFPGETEVDQLFLIQNLLGNFTEDQKQTFRNNPRFSSYTLRDITKTETTLDKKFASKADKKALHLLKSLLQIDPRRRLSSSEALHHPFFDCVRDALYPSISHLTAPTSVEATPNIFAHRPQSVERGASGNRTVIQHGPSKKLMTDPEAQRIDDASIRSQMLPQMPLGKIELESVAEPQQRGSRIPSNDPSKQQVLACAPSSTTTVLPPRLGSSHGVRAPGGQPPTNVRPVPERDSSVEADPGSVVKSSAALRPSQASGASYVNPANGGHNHISSRPLHGIPPPPVKHGMVVGLRDTTKRGHAHALPRIAPSLSHHFLQPSGGVFPTQAGNSLRYAMPSNGGVPTAGHGDASGGGYYRAFFHASDNPYSSVRAYGRGGRTN